MADLKCKKHPKYQAKREPKSNCIDCQKIWKLKRELEAPKSKSPEPVNTWSDQNEDCGHGIPPRRW